MGASRIGCLIPRVRVRRLWIGIAAISWSLTSWACLPASPLSGRVDAKHNIQNFVTVAGRELPVDLNPAVGDQAIGILLGHLDDAVLADHEVLFRGDCVATA